MEEPADREYRTTDPEEQLTIRPQESAANSAKKSKRQQPRKERAIKRKM